METKLIISYIVICATYTICRLHYLLIVETDSELNKMLEELVDYAGDKSIIGLYIILQLACCPILAPLSVLKHIKNFIVKSKNI